MHSDLSSDPRVLALKSWLAGVSQPVLVLDSLRPASSDASFRRYFRLDGADGKTYIAMDAPPPQEDVGPFMHVAEVFGKTGVSVPEILASETSQGF
jgi:aminoglycoside/choline kinase family phosphotransferase